MHRSLALTTTPSPEVLAMKNHVARITAPVAEDDGGLPSDPAAQQALDVFDRYYTGASTELRAKAVQAGRTSLLGLNLTEAALYTDIGRLAALKDFSKLVLETSDYSQAQRDEIRRTGEVPAAIKDKLYDTVKRDYGDQVMTDGKFDDAKIKDFIHAAAVTGERKIGRKIENLMALMAWQKEMKDSKKQRIKELLEDIMSSIKFAQSVSSSSIA